MCSWCQQMLLMAYLTDAELSVLWKTVKEFQWCWQYWWHCQWSLLPEGVSSAWWITLQRNGRKAALSLQTNWWINCSWIALLTSVYSAFPRLTLTCMTQKHLTDGQKRKNAFSCLKFETRSGRELYNLWSLNLAAKLR